jgi:hypothetical protein
MEQTRITRTKEALKRHPVRTAIAGGLVVSMTAVGIDYMLYDDGTRPIPANSCLSPFNTISEKGDPGASFLTPLLGDRRGIKVRGFNEKALGTNGIYGIQAAFKAPGDKDWQQISPMMPLNKKTNIATVVLAIGKGDVEFGIRAVAPHGSVACETMPQMDVALQDVGEFRQVPGECPWRTPVAYLVDRGVIDQ